MKAITIYLDGDSECYGRESKYVIINNYMICLLVCLSVAYMYTDLNCTAERLVSSFCIDYCYCNVPVPVGYFSLTI